VKRASSKPPLISSCSPDSPPVLLPYGTESPKICICNCEGLIRGKERPNFITVDRSQGWGLEGSLSKLFHFLGVTETVHKTTTFVELVDLSGMCKMSRKYAIQKTMARIWTFYEASCRTCKR
jgi:hypothetical protein